MNLQSWILGFSIFQFIVNSCIALWAYRVSRDKVTNTRFKELEDRTLTMELGSKNLPSGCPGHTNINQRMDGHSDRLAQHKEMLNAVQAELKHMPKVRDLEKVYERVNEVKSQMTGLTGEVGKISGAMPGIVHVTEMMNTFLLNNGGKK